MWWRRGSGGDVGAVATWERWLLAGPSPSAGAEHRGEVVHRATSSDDMGVAWIDGRGEAVLAQAALMPGTRWRGKWRGTGAGKLDGEVNLCGVRVDIGATRGEGK